MKKTVILIGMCILSAISHARTSESTNDITKVLGKATVKRLEAIANQRRLQSRTVTNGVMICTYTQSGRTWTVTNQIFRANGYVKPPRYSRLKLFVAVSQIGKWDDLEAWLKSQNVNGMNAWTAFMLANDLASDNELFILWLNKAKEALGVDDATVQAILKAAEE